MKHKLCIDINCGPKLCYVNSQNWCKFLFMPANRAQCDLFGYLDVKNGKPYRHQNCIKNSAIDKDEI